MREIRDPVKRFYDLCIPEPNSGCWLWLGPLNAKGYGRLSIRKKRVLAHRFSHQQFKGDVPKHLCVLHECDNKLCVNPEHLSTGTQAKNSADMVARGRVCCGEARETSKLSAQEARYIRMSAERGVDLARCFNISQQVVCDIRKGRSWKHLREELL